MWSMWKEMKHNVKMSDTSVADIPMSAPKYVFISLDIFFLTEINTSFQ